MKNLSAFPYRGRCILRNRLALVLAVSLGPQWLIGCLLVEGPPPLYDQRASTARKDLNKGLQLIQSHNGAVAYLYGMSPLTMYVLPDETLREAQRYFDSATKNAIAAGNDYFQAFRDEYVDMSPAETDKLYRHGDQLSAPSALGLALSSEADAALALHKAERLLAAGNKAAAIESAESAYEDMDFMQFSGVDEALPDIFDHSHVDAIKRSLHDAKKADFAAVFVEVMKIRVGPAAVAHPQTLPENPLYWYEMAALQNKLHNLNHAAHKMDNYKARALKYLRKAVALGFHDWNELRTDPDFKWAQSLPEFKRLCRH